MGKRAEKEQVAIQLYAEGKEIPQISLELEVSENSLRAWKTGDSHRVRTPRPWR